MANTPRLTMPYLVAGQAQKEITHNDALNDIDSLAQLSVVNRTTATPPAMPMDGDSYIIASNPTGAWAGNAYAVASYYSGWRIKPARAGWLAYVQDERALYVFDGMEWSLLKRATPSSGNTFAFLGDSRLAYQFYDGTSTPYPASGAHAKSAISFFNWANALSGQRMKTVYNAAVAGYRSDQYLTADRVSGAIASGAKWLVIWGVINDIVACASTGDTALTIWTRIKNAAQTALNAGMNVILLTEPGSDSSGTNTMESGMINQFNQYMLEYAEGTSGIFCFDCASYVINPLLTDKRIRPGYSNDGVHPNSYGSYHLGVAFADFMSHLIPPLQSQIYTAADVSSKGNVQQVSNPLFLTTTGGTSGAGITGNTPLDYISGRSGGATATISTSAASDGFGNEVTIAGTFTSAGEVLYLKQDTLASNYSVGDVVDSGVEIVINSGAVNLGRAALSSSFGGTTVNVCDLYGTGIPPNALPGVAMDLVLKSEPFTIPEGTTWYAWAVGFVAAGAGSFTAKIKRPWMRRRFVV